MTAATEEIDECPGALGCFGGASTLAGRRGGGWRGFQASCLPARLIACLLACLLACSPARLLAGSLAGSLAFLLSPASFPACLFVRLLACSLACSVCLTSQHVCLHFSSRSAIRMPRLTWKTVRFSRRSGGSGNYKNTKCAHLLLCRDGFYPSYLFFGFWPKESGSPCFFHPSPAVIYTEESSCLAASTGFRHER